MKIIFKILKAGSGGDVYFEILKKALDKTKIKSEIIYFNKNYEIFPLLLNFINKKIEGDIIHSNAEYGWAYKEKDKPLFITIHHNVFDIDYIKDKSLLQKIYHSLILKSNIKRSLDFADKIIAVSNYTKNSIIETFGNYPITVIYNGIDTDKFKPIKVKTTDKRFKLLFVGNLIKRKGSDLLPKIMQKLGKDYALYYTSGLRSKIPKDFNLPNMIPLGRLSEEDLIKEYNKCDALLFPTRLEGFGYAAAEAMACGKPVISTNCSSIPEVVEDGKNGFLCEMNNVDDFFKKIKFLAKDKKLRDKMGKVNRKKSIEKFSYKNINIEYIKEYKLFKNN